MKVQIACTSDELEAVGRLRYTVYVEELGKTLAFADHLRRQVRDVHDADALHLFVAAGGEMVGCVRIHANAVPQVLADPLELWRFHCETSRDFALVSKLIIHPAHRHTTVFGRLLRAVHKLAINSGVRTLFCTTFPHLVPMYCRMGFRNYREMHLDPDFGPHYALAGSVSDSSKRLFRDSKRSLEYADH